jgi:ABC-type phosphate/phosphonate transport system substrate-binding protein
MAENAEVFCEQIARYVEDRLDIATDYIAGIPWQEREKLFDQGSIQILWLCGFPYVDKADSLDGAMELCAAPIPAAPRYNGRPVYFSDVVVRHDSPYRSFLELRGAAWAFNEPRSHSGFNVVRAYLAELGQSQGFFGTATESGAHTRSIEMILAGDVAGAAIDSTVLEWAISENPDLKERLRVIETIGPSPIPPWVISNSVPKKLRDELRGVFLAMDGDIFGREILRGSGIERFDAVLDSDYDPIRRMARKAHQVLLA